MGTYEDIENLCEKAKEHEELKQLAEAVDKWLHSSYNPLALEEELREDNQQYQKHMTKNKCRKCGNFVCEEINKEIDYPYYCPNCDENMYSFEVEEVDNSANVRRTKK